MGEERRMEYDIFTSLEEAREKGIEKVREDIYCLWQECFGDTDSYTDFYFQWVVPYNRIFTLYKEDKLCSMLHLNPYTLAVKENEVKADYIVGVATRKEERKKGYMGLLIEKALQWMYEEGKPFTYLMPAAEVIYYPYDFRKVYTLENWGMEMEKAVLKGSSKNTGSRLVKLTASDIDSRRVLTEFTEDILRREYDIYALRSRKYYEKLLAEMNSTKGGIALVLKKDDLIGYAAYMQDDGFQIAECIYELSDKEEVLLELYREFSPGLSLSLNDRKADFEPAIMMRIVNLKAFLLSLYSERETSLVIEAKDERIAENNGVFHLVTGKEGSSVDNTEEPPMLRGNISDLTLLFFGKLEEEKRKELITVEEKDSVLAVLSELQIGNRLFLNEIV
ncbi:GNAT family N-acetyltransferase [Anaerocolumna jejuensis]|uniref:GNAT family N-acetyltransferase n=1 Tax=Anaerocolumna jejuensis TaxID=259063 RepID=UPI003F7B96B4